MFYNTSIPQGGYQGPNLSGLAAKQGPNLSEVFMSPYQRQRVSPAAQQGAQRQSDDAYRSTQWAGIRGLGRDHAQTNADLSFQQTQGALGNSMDYFGGLRGQAWQQQQQQNPMQNYILSTLFSGGF
jgi:hypothetical protein